MGGIADAIDAKQHLYPPVTACPSLARIPLDALETFQLFIGSADAASDPSTMAEHGIQSVISLGTGPLAPPPVETLCIDILDMEDAFILEHFDTCLAFLKEQARIGKSTLVHCVYGQSRSATICVAFVMLIDRMSLEASYDRVQAARPCIHINRGFLAQLELFQAMQCQLVGASSAHATYRTMATAQRRSRDRLLALDDDSLHGAPGTAKRIYCMKCNFHLCSHDNAVFHAHKSASAATACGSLFVEPMPWMQLMEAGDQGKLSCPRCKSKLGVFSWFGIKCTQGMFCQPAFQLSTARVESR
ncbi:hypothetical protein LEN26_012961 [Aphanomyces euteiches]|nr:hypothetical protein LEN26_012961 [Aphanomyces euteiches]KAH9122684.1 hypothetical protein AeMF1_006110 [Aphanomyces euteiches]KAH9183344.1 hypothetical protein AeNC1_014682 [Aphanomyces euteiches]